MTHTLATTKQDPSIYPSEEISRPPVGFKRQPTFEVLIAAVILFFIARMILNYDPLVPRAPTPRTCQTCP